MSVEAKILKFQYYISERLHEIGSQPGSDEALVDE